MEQWPLFLEVGITANVTDQESLAVVSLVSQEVYSDAFYQSIYKVGSKKRMREKEHEIHQLFS